MKLKQIETKTVHIFCFLCNNIQVTWQSPQRRKVQVLLERRLNEEREILTNDKSHVRHESRFPPLLRPQIQSPLPKTLVIWSIFSPFLDFSHSSLLLYLWFIISSKNVKSSLGFNWLFPSPVSLRLIVNTTHLIVILQFMLYWALIFLKKNCI